MSEFVSIAQLPDTVTLDGSENAPIVWDFPLPPHVDQDRLVINARHLRQLHKIGGIAASKVEAYDGQLSETSAAVVGINADGSALAGGRSAHKKADTSRGHYVDAGGIVTSEVGHTVLVHPLNKPELASEVANAVQSGASSDEAWASRLDSAMRQSMRQGGKQHLMMRTDTFGRTYSAGFTATMLSLAAQYPEPAIGGASVASYAFMQSINLAQQYVCKRRHNQYPPVRWSIFPMAMQADRYLALNTLSRKPGLIKSLK